MIKRKVLAFMILKFVCMRGTEALFTLWAKFPFFFDQKCDSSHLFFSRHFFQILCAYPSTFQIEKRMGVQLRHWYRIHRHLLTSFFFFPSPDALGDDIVAHFTLDRVSQILVTRASLHTSSCWSLDTMGEFFRAFF